MLMMLINLVTTALWFKLLKAWRLVLRRRVMRMIEDNGYHSFEQAMEFPLYSMVEW